MRVHRVKEAVAAVSFQLSGRWRLSPASVPRTITEADLVVVKDAHTYPLACSNATANGTLAEVERVTHNSAQSAHQRYLEIFKII